MKYFAKFNHSVSVTVPTTVAIDVPADARAVQAQVDHIVRVFSVNYGGATVTEGQGAWYSDELKKIVYEPVKIVTAYHDSDGQHGLIESLAMDIKNMLHQEAVLYTVDGVAYLV